MSDECSDNYNCEFLKSSEDDFYSEIISEIKEMKKINPKCKTNALEVLR